MFTQITSCEVEWNQYVTNPTLETTSGWSMNGNGFTPSVNNNEMSVYDRIVFTSDQSLYTPVGNHSGHKIYATFECNFNGDIIRDIRGSWSLPPHDIPNTWGRVYGIFDAPTYPYFTIYCCLKSGISVEVGDYLFTFRNPQYIDLTQMFGAGNEPTSISEFETWLSVNHLDGCQPYNSGETIITTKPRWL